MISPEELPSEVVQDVTSISRAGRLGEGLASQVSLTAHVLRWLLSPNAI